MGYVGNQTTTAFTSMDKQDITGDGTPNYTLSHAVANSNEIEVFVNNVRQEPTVAYSASGTTLTMTGNVASTDDFYVVYQGKAVGTIVPPDGSVTSAKLDTNIAVAGDLTVDTNTLHVDSTNNLVGVGTTTPSTLLHLSSTDPRITLTDTDTGADHRINASSGAGNLAFDIDVNSETANPSAIFNIKGSEAMRIKDSGEVLIGTPTGTNRKLTVNQDTTGGAVRVVRTTHSDTSTAIMDIIDGDDAVSGTRTILNLDFEDDANVDNAVFIRFQDEGGTIGRIEANSTSVTYHTTSDYRLKDNVEEYNSGFDKIKNIRPVTFDWVKTGTSDVGFIAHELAEHIPNVVSGIKDARTTKEKSDGTIVDVIDPQSVDYGKLTPYLTSALKEAINKIETLETEMTALTARVTALEAN